MEVLTNDTSFHLGNIDANAHILQHDHNHHVNQIQQLFINAKAALAADQLGDAQQTLTQLSTCIQDNLLPACVALRAYTCQRQQAYVEGAALADQYIDRKQDNPDGYLLAGNMRLLSGDTETALQIYRKGMQRSSQSHLQYLQLVNERSRVEQQISRSNTRLIRTLPPEVLYGTLSFLRRSELSALACTCRAWHKLIMEWPGTWHEISIGCMDHLLPSSGLQQFLAYAPSQHVQRLSFRNNDRILRPHAYAMITRYNWDHLEELDIYCDGQDTVSHRGYIERSDTAIPIIRNCKNTLKRLRLTFDCGSQVLNYSLENCPKLESLIFNDNHDDEDDDDDGAHFQDAQQRSTVPAGQFRLRHIVIQGESTSFDIADLVSKCPNLERLELAHFGSDREEDFSAIAEALYNHCPRIHTLKLYTWTGSWVEPNLSDLRQQHPDNQTHGLRELTFNMDPLYICDSLTQLVRDSQHSLEMVDASYSLHHVMLYRMFNGIQLDNLRVLRCASVDPMEDDVIIEESFNMLETIIGTSPRLQNVDIPQDTASDRILQALGRLSNLNQLCFTVDKRVTWAGLVSLFSHTRSLQKVNMGLRGFYTSIRFHQLIKAVAGCKPLEELEVSSDVLMDISEVELQDLATYIKQQQPNLHNVVVTASAHGLSNNIILMWSSFKQLRHLCIRNTKIKDRPISSWECAIMAAMIGIPGLKIKFEQPQGSRSFQLDSNGNYCGSNEGETPADELLFLCQNT